MDFLILPENRERTVSLGQWMFGQTHKVLQPPPRNILGTVSDTTMQKAVGCVPWPLDDASDVKYRDISETQKRGLA